MRDYGKISTSIFTDPNTATWNSDTFRVAAYLLAGPHTNSIGCFRLPIGYLAEDLKNMPNGSQSDAIKTLVEEGFIRYCESTNWIWIPNFLIHNPFTSINMAKAAVQTVKSVPDACTFFPDFCENIRECGKWDWNVKGDTVCLSDDLPLAKRCQSDGAQSNSYSYSYIDSYRNSYLCAFGPLVNDGGSDQTEEDGSTIAEQLDDPENDKSPDQADLELVAENENPVDHFERFNRVYPKREGADPLGKAKAKFDRFVKKGVDPNEIVAGAMRYAKFCDAKGRTGTEFVKQKQYWLNDELWREEWEINDQSNSSAGELEYDPMEARG